MTGRLLDALRLRWLSAELFWTFGVLAAVALGVQITGKGIDILAVMSLGALVVLFDTAYGDKFAEVLGPTIWSVALLSIALLGGWGLMKKNGAADRFFRSAERAGYQTLYYDSTAKPPVPDIAANSRVNGAPSSVPATSQPHDPDNPSVSADAEAVITKPADRKTTAAVGFALPKLAPWGGTRKTPVLRIEAPEIVTTGSPVTIRARLMDDGKPVGGQSVIFTVDSRVVAVRATDNKGIATASFTPRVAALYQLRLHVEETGEFRESVGRAILHVIPGTR